ncbi:MAG: bifunctional 23S rRNA (guanine(2069)-N(7))-methyltransferase RlmK/23S rRNA (guanine(2445)-N(2))-methyltransferase RlmL, partial [Oleiphilaceae bacterium]|nr:bifunctional 23S rRNA (guanine(2069)-N(7))-methyltransferase RlmK/23S rRNA (guanine(2445)-N(2))-methyltransferase RlmL [Oleiphilaceae bacterium]
MLSADTHVAFISAPKGLQYALEQELRELGLEQLRATPAGVEAEASLESLYQVLLWSRIANRVVVELVRAKVAEADELYEAAKSIDWTEHFDLTNSFAVDFHGSNVWLKNSTFGALRIKDAIVDQFRDACGERPSVSRDKPDIRVSARLHKGQVIIGLDLSGESLHRRGYRQSAGKAPLKENLAAGLLRLASWKKDKLENKSLMDPMCGSGTLVIEAAMIATDKAPGLEREQWGFSAWKQHQSSTSACQVDDARARFKQGLSNNRCRIVGYDEHAPVVKKAWENIERAGLSEVVHVERCALHELKIGAKLQPGLVITNPPYGERLGEQKKLYDLYRLLGDVFEQQLMGWQGAVLTSAEVLGRQIGWRSHKQYKVFNGALESQLLLFDLQSQQRYREAWQSQADRLADSEKWRITSQDRANMLANRLMKNIKTVGKWAKKQGVSCYRLYDADMPEFAFALDLYQAEGEEAELAVHLQEYMPPKTLPDKVAFERLSEAMCVVRDTLEVPGERIFLKRRQRQKGLSQYEKQAAKRFTRVVREYDARIEVNLSDYLDTGLFLDHRPARRWITEHSQGKAVLNLFCYTSVVSLQAALGGAKSSLSIDMSKTYLAWAQRNYALNGLDQSCHQLLQADCLEWLRKTPSSDEMFDVIFLDPPSFSNSKRMEGILDIQRDHAELVSLAMQRLTPGGVLFFSNNLQKFALDDRLSDQYAVEDWTSQSIDKDFARRPGIHHCWLI